MRRIYEVDAKIITVLFLLILAGTGTLGMLLDKAPETLYTVCTAKERAFQSVFNHLYEIIDDPEAKETLELLNQGQQISQSSKNYLNKVLMKKDFKLHELVCEIVSNSSSIKNTESVDCETLSGADGIDGFSFGDTSWAEACYEIECENLSGADNMPGFTPNDTSWAKLCYDQECESAFGADNKIGHTSNDTGWAKLCYESRNRINP